MSIPCIILERDNWDDYGRSTNFSIAIYGENRKLIHHGSIKILQINEKYTFLPEEFESLDDTFCSLWQELQDYQIINDLDFGHDIWSTLNDVNFNEIIRDKFQNVPGFEGSLRRFSEAERAYQEGRKLIKNEQDLSSFSFAYIEGEQSPTPFGIIHFKFSRKLKGIYRVIGVIGRNGVGKTTLMANLAISLSGMKMNSTKLSPRPPFGPVIAVSYSTFDDFYRPSKNERTFSYNYCGIRGENDLLSKKEINESFYSSFRNILKSGRLKFWEECMNIIYLNQLETYLPNRKRIMQSYNKLSSGQKIMTMSLTQIINFIDNNSILLFDEPENHLHPNGQNSLFKCLDYILTKFDSFAIISTHSPIFIQNIPSKNVFKLSSAGGVRSVQTLSIESFGQHFSKLTEEIFGFSERNLFYVEKLKELYDSREELGNEYFDLSQIDSIGARFHLRNLEND